MLVSGYEIRRIRGTREFALILHTLDEYGSYTTLRLVDEDPAELLRYVRERSHRFGEEFEGETRKCNFNVRGKGQEGFIVGHSVAIDDWNGVLGYSWVDLQALRGSDRINVPVACFRTPVHEIEIRPGEQRWVAYAEYVRLTIAALREQFPLRTVLKLTETADGYELSPEPAVDTKGSKELRA